ncbi:MAG TPA: hypothetical protein GXZ77_05770 [Papillibacter sp.]|nr:hypothetical protein [Papillibacter sp.]
MLQLVFRQNFGGMKRQRDEITVGEARHRPKKRRPVCPHYPFQARRGA